MSNSNEFAQFIEELRISRSIDKEDFVDGVVSLRQYYRFIRGESSLKNESINALLEKLEISSTFTYERFKKKTDADYSNLMNIYDEVYKSNYDHAEKLFNELIKSDLISIHNRKIYDFLEIRFDIHYKRIIKEKYIDKILELMDYPNILKKDALSFVELSCIMLVHQDLTDRGDYRLSDYTYSILRKDDDFHSNEHKNYLMPFQISTIKNLGRIGKHEDSLILAEQVIEEFEKYTALNAYASTIYLKAMNQRDTYKDERYKTTLTKLFCLLKSQKNKQFGYELKETIKRSFNIVESDLVTYRAIKK